MAKKSSRSGSKRTYEIQRSFPLILDGSPDTNAMVRVDRALGAINHRLYRQSRLYSCKLDLDPNVAAGTAVDVWALCDTWWLQKAYRLAYKTFVENGEDEASSMGSARARWNDFRVDSGLGTAFQKDLMPSGNLVPTGADQIYGTGSDQEYLMSVVHDTNGAQKTFVFSGGTASEFNIITEYDNTANTDAAPSTPNFLASYDGLHDEVDQGQAAHLAADGNLPPYKANTFEGAVWIKVATLHVASTGAQKLSTGFFKAPAGMIAITSTEPFADSTFLNLEVKAGDYKGVHATTMLE